VTSSIGADARFTVAWPLAEWRDVCDRIEREFRAGRFADGMIAGIGERWMA